jgi:two-component system heavy metal sensor histidine kinase CusS
VTAEKPWSITRRISKGFVLTTAGVALAIAAVSAFFLDLAVERELTALVHEEFEELRLLTRAGDPTLEELEDWVRDVEVEHPSNPMGFRVWKGAAAEPWCELGTVALLAPERPARDGQLGPLSGPDGLRWGTARVSDDLVVGLAIDGSAQLALFNRYWLVSLGLVGLATAIALAGGALFIRSTSRLLERVAERARSASWNSPEQELHLPGAPEEIRRITEALAQMRANIRQEAERVRLMATGMAHELGSPIQNLVGETEVALMRERSAEEYRNLLQSQIEELRDLARAVGNLVALCSMDPTARQEELEVFDLAEELEVRLRRERTRAAQAGITLEVACEGDLALRGDREAVLLALCNLVANAIAWSPPGGRVGVHAARSGERVEVSVEDQGPGIPEELRERVFEPFFRGPTARGRRAGYGLGLSIAKAAVEAHGGSIALGSAPGGGACFKVALACDGAAPPSPEARPGKSSAATRPEAPPVPLSTTRAPASHG